VAARDLAVFTTGMISREAFVSADRPSNLYVIGSMGLASSLALGMALAQPEKRVFAVDGDGSALMSMGSLAMIAREHPANLVHIVLDNQVYGSTGNQPSLSDAVALERVAAAAGYPWTRRAASIAELEQALEALAEVRGPAFLLAQVAASEVAGIGRVTVTPEDLAGRFRAVASQAHT
jgi:thiamine pyrophosphate-dependent acetolactate synthase large subunit-like protein